jgi:L,D-transpeptidase catalytic domain
MTAFPVRLHLFLSALALATALATPSVATHAQGFSSVSSGTSRAKVVPPQGAVVDASSVQTSTLPRVDSPSAQAPVAADSVPILASAVPAPPAFGGTLAAAAPVMPSQPTGAGSVSPAVPTPAAPVPAPIAPVGAASSALSTSSGGFSSVSGGAPSLPAPPATSANYGAGSASAFEMADKVLVVKHERVLRLLRRGRVIAEYPIKLGLNPYGHKQREGDFRTPEGNYELVFRNPKSEFFLSIKISYPNREDAAVAHESGFAPGGLIMIHGQPNEPKRSPEHYATRDWTDGCIALSNADMVDVWLRTTTGTPIEIRK